MHPDDIEKVAVLAPDARKTATLGETVFPMERQTGGVQGGYTGQENGDPQGAGVFDQAVEQAGSETATGKLWENKVREFGRVGKDRQGMVRTQEAETGDATVRRFGHKRGVSGRGIQIAIEEFAGQRRLGIGGKAVLDVVIENVHDWTAVFLAQGLQYKFHIANRVLAGRVSLAGRPGGPEEGEANP